MNTPLFKFGVALTGLAFMALAITAIQIQERLAPMVQGVAQSWTDIWRDPG